LSFSIVEAMGFVSGLCPPGDAKLFADWAKALWAIGYASVRSTDTLLGFTYHILGYSLDTLKCIQNMWMAQRN